MRVVYSTIVAAAVLAATIDAQDENNTFDDLTNPVEAEEIGDYRMPYDFYSRLDFGAGFLIGVYGPIQSRWRNDDCRSKFFKLASNLTSYSKYFDYDPEKSSAVDPVGAFGLHLIITGLAGYGTWDTCMSQYDDIQDVDDWTTNFNLLAFDEQQPTKRSHPAVKAGLVENSLSFLGLFMSIRSAFANVNSEYYYFHSGKSIGSFLGNSFTLADEYLDLGIINPEDPWDRYTA